MMKLEATSGNCGMEKENCGFWALYRAFFNVGIYTVGGAYAMIPVAERMLVSLFSTDEILEAFTIAQTLPGVIAANTSAILGHRKRGIWGAIVAVLGVITPSILIISLIAVVFSSMQSIEVINRAFAGIRIAVLAFLVKSAYELWKKSILGLWTWAIFAVSFGLVLFKIIPAPYVVAIAACSGLVRGKFGRRI